MLQSIDSTLFVGPGEGDHFVCECVIAAPRSAVYRAWTDAEAFAMAYAPDRPELKADIELRIGGKYEWLWDGKHGSNDCQILSFIPDRMLSFGWNAPPEQPQSRALRSWVVVEFEDTTAGGTRLRLTHLGFGRAEHWRETSAYFQMAWLQVFRQFRRNLEG